jgi:hypothetical protein
MGIGGFRIEARRSRVRFNGISTWIVNRSRFGVRLLSVSTMTLSLASELLPQGWCVVGWRTWLISLSRPWHIGLG